MTFNLKKKITDFHYGKKNIFLFLLFFVPAVFYYFVISVKNFLYKIKFLKETKTKPFVICVGNLTTGGVGKTPVVIELANYLSLKGFKTVVLSRGYGGKLNKKKVNLIRNYNEILINDSVLTGDEADLISKKISNAALITTSDRVKGANYASDILKSDVVIMDDGFSNRKIYKDLNILLTDSKKAFGNGFCLPLGPLREPVSEIKRADKIIVVEKGESGALCGSLKSILKTENFYICKMKNNGIYNIKTKNKLTEKKIIAFSAIGQPEQFYALLKDFEVKNTISFDDHFNYNQKTVDEINRTMKESSAKAAVTTEKDKVKLLRFNQIENFYALELSSSINLDELLKDIKLFN